MAYLPTVDLPIDMASVDSYASSYTKSLKFTNHPWPTAPQRFLGNQHILPEEPKYYLRDLERYFIRPTIPGVYCKNLETPTTNHEDLPQNDVHQRSTKAREQIGLTLHWSAMQTLLEAPVIPLIEPESHLNGGGLNDAQPPTQDQNNDENRVERPAASSCGEGCAGTFVGAHRCEKNPRKIYCCAVNCQYTCYRRGEFNRHYKSLHLRQFEKLDCPFRVRDKCSKFGQNGFTRKDNLLQHIRRRHEKIPVVQERLNGSTRTRTTIG